MPGYSLMNARITYETGDGKWNVAVSVENLLDKFYWYTLAPSGARSLDYPWTIARAARGEGVRRH